MARNSKSTAQVPAAKSKKWTPPQIARLVLGVLVLVNIGAAWWVMNPPGGSAEDLDHRHHSSAIQIRQAKTRADEVKKHADAVTKGRTAADEFLNQYFVTRAQRLPTTLIKELNRIAQKAGIKDRGNSNSGELIEGSDTLGMVTITWNFEATTKAS
ncbi:MAG: hypothetical protein WDO18_16320 [Acidobacteriota bacterium]